GPLLKNAQNHLAKLRRDNPGTHTNIQRGLEDVMSQLGQQLPRVLTLREQAVFALGYYYQRAARWSRLSGQEKSESNPKQAQ
ncbi:MAG: type I-C CRISPR-associated protein Cas8c/Csd1, partial [Chloroflexota bacterium]|nr:type I-C CRISPR-associated protein Cas8c/Csd1 [Chloroflexota bacterium]